MQFNLVFRSLRHLSHARFALACWFSAMSLLLLLWWWMTDFALSTGNLWQSLFTLHIVVYILFCLLFGLFIAATVYKISYFGEHTPKNTFLGGIWWFVWILVAWCPACAISIASYIWLASVVALLPRHGLELKILGVLLVGYAAWKALVTMEVCELK